MTTKCQETDNITVRTLPELNMAALEKHLDRQLRLWYLARFVENGEPWVDRQRVIDAAVPYMHPATSANVLVAGEGLFWKSMACEREGIVRLYLTGTIHLCKQMGVEIPRKWVELLVVRSLAQWRSMLMETFISTGHDGKRMISQSTLANRIGRTRNTVTNYLQDVEKEKNSVVTERKTLTPELARSGHHRTVVNGETVIARRLPNRYRSKRRVGGFGQGKRMQAGSLHTGRGTDRRLYFDDSGRAARRIERLRDGETVYVRLGETCALGHVMWAGIMRVDDSVYGL